MEARQEGPERRGLERLHEGAGVQQRVAQVRRAVAIPLPRLARLLLADRPLLLEDERRSSLARGHVIAAPLVSRDRQRAAATASPERLGTRQVQGGLRL